MESSGDNRMGNMPGTYTSITRYTTQDEYI